jgi:hypothetical protein
MIRILYPLFEFYHFCIIFASEIMYYKWKEYNLLQYNQDQNNFYIQVLCNKNNEITK